MSTFQAVSARLGELRLDDLGSLADVKDSIPVLALDNNGIAVLLNVRLTGKWGGAGWQLAFECPRCWSAARVLAVNGDAVACGRCQRRQTLQSRRKNQREWAEGRLADELARGLLSYRPRNERQMRATARRLQRRALAKALATLALADGVIRTANRALREKHD